jgi:predicted SAM-dependent methyltransferase
LRLTPAASAGRASPTSIEATLTKQKYLNLGCGARLHPAWTNVDIAPQSAGVMACNLRGPLPFADASFAAVYHSHVLEHFPHEEAKTFLRECFRVLEPGGVLRVVVPDLEQIARLYLEALERVLQGQGEWQAHYEWIMLELYDQTVREQPGGDMRRYLEGPSVPNEQFVVSRTGVEGQRLLAAMRASKVPSSLPQPVPTSAVRRLWRGARRRSSHLRESLVRLLLGDEWAALQIGRFRLSGEIHRWMYDRYSLSQLLLAAGFVSPRRVHAAESEIEGWPSYCLDVEPDGTVYKPDSLFMEARRLAVGGEGVESLAATLHGTQRHSEASLAGHS